MFGVCYYLVFFDGGDATLVVVLRVVTFHNNQTEGQLVLPLHFPILQGTEFSQKVVLLL